MFSSDIDTTAITHMIKSGTSLEKIQDMISYREDLGSQLLRACGKANISVDALAGLCGLNRNSIYKALRGQSVPEKDTLIRMAFVLKMSLESTNEMLKSARRGALSAHDRRELYLMEGLISGLTLTEMDERLVRSGLQPLL